MAILLAYFTTNSYFVMSYKHIPLGSEAPDKVNVVMEIQKGSRNKYEYDEELDVIKLDRVLHASVFYPTDYGFLPETRSEDGDHLDALVLSSENLMTGSMAEVRPVGVLEMVDGGDLDWKIIAVVDADPRWRQVSEIDDVNEHYKKEIAHFFATYKHLEGKEVEVKDWLPRERALELIKEGQNRYAQEGHGEQVS